MPRKKLSAMSAIPQFQTAIRQPSNLDRCNRCGVPRSAHGIDWACPRAFSMSNARLAVLVVSAGLLALVGVLVLTLTSTTQTNVGTLGAASCLTGLTFLVCSAIFAGRRR
jgi:hypothetical protein